MTQEVINNVTSMRFPSLDNKTLQYHAYRMPAAKFLYAQRTTFDNLSESIVNDTFADPNDGYTEFILAEADEHAHRLMLDNNKLIAMSSIGYWYY